MSKCIPLLSQAKHQAVVDGLQLFLLASSARANLLVTAGMIDQSWSSISCSDVRMLLQMQKDGEGVCGFQQSLRVSTHTHTLTTGTFEPL